MPRSTRADAVVDGSSPAYQLFMLALSIYVLIALACSSLLPLNEGIQHILAIIDLLVCGIFLLDFLYQLSTTRDRRRWFLRWGWLDLLSCIPLVDHLRWGRVVRVVRLVRMLRSLRLVHAFLLRRRGETALLSVGLIAFLTLVFGSIAVLHFEHQGGGSIASADRALWWAIVTLTTVGYGDFAPVTVGGRLVAAVMMVIGVGVFGTFTGLVATLFFKSPAAGTPPPDDAPAPAPPAILGELRALREEVAALRQILSDRPATATIAAPEVPGRDAGTASGSPTPTA